MVKENKDTKEKKEVKPKRPLSAYMFFVKENREKIAKKNPDMNFKQVSQEVGKVWKTLSPGRKRKYEIMASNDRRKKLKERQKLQQSGSKKPKRALSGYMFYVKENRAKYAKKFPNKSSPQIMSDLGKQWRDLTPGKRKKYMTLAEGDKKRYVRQMEKHKKYLAMKKEDNK